MKALSGRAALVTGGGRGIGAATAMALGRAGASVVLAARTLGQVEAAAARLRDEGLEALALRCDVTEPEQVIELGRAAREVTGGIDILVNNAGTATSNPLGRITLEEWNRVMAVNATGTFLCTQALLPGMLERGWGRVVNVASVAGLAGAKYIAAYAAAKHAVVGFTRAVAAEVAGTGVTVAAVCPGYVDTPLTDATVARIVRKTGADPERALARLLEQAGQTRLIRADEVADTIVALCTDTSADTNGEAILLGGNDRA